MALTAPTTVSDVLWELEVPNARVFVDFRGMLIFPFDFFLLGLLTISVIRAIVHPAWRHHLRQAVIILARSLGGQWWCTLVLLMGISVVWAIEPSLVYIDALRLSLELTTAVVLATATWREDGDRWIASMLILGAVSQALIALAQFLNGGSIGLGWLHEPVFRGWRSFGLTVNPNNLAGFLMLALFTAGYLLKSRYPTGGKRKFIIAATVLIVMGIITTFSRTVILGVITGITVCFLKDRKVGSGWRIAFITAGLIAIVVLLILRAEMDTSIEASQSYNRIMYRFSDTWAVIQQSPILGVGANHLMLNIARMHEGAVNLLFPVHNVFLVVWAELGVVGLGLLILAFWVPLRALYDQLDSATLGLTCGILAVVVVMLFDYYFWRDFRSRVVLMWYWGLWWGAILRYQSEPHQTGALHKPT